MTYYTCYSEQIMVLMICLYYESNKCFSQISSYNNAYSFKCWSSALFISLMIEILIAGNISGWKRQGQMKKEVRNVGNNFMFHLSLSLPTGYYPTINQ